MDTPKSDFMDISTDVDWENSIAGIQVTCADVADKSHEQRTGVVCRKPEDDELRMVISLHQTDRVQKRRLMVVDVSKEPSMLANNVSDFLVQSALRRRLS